MTALTLYGSNVASTTLTSACKLSTTTGGTETTVTTTGPASGNGYVEFLSQGGTATLNASIPAPTGKGWLYDSTALEGQTIAAGNWSASFGAQDNAGSGPVQSYTLGLFKRSSGGTYTSIGNLTIGSTTIATTRTTYNYSASGLSSMAFGVGDKLYIHQFIQATGWASDPIVNYVSNSATAGVANDLQINTPGYSPTATTNTEAVTETYSGSELVTTTLFTLNSDSVTETYSGSETVVMVNNNLSNGAVTETYSGSEVVVIATTNLSSPSAQMTRQDMDFEYNHIKVCPPPVGTALKILASVYYGSPSNSQTINGELDALLPPETISQLHVMKTRNDVLTFIRSYSYLSQVLADTPQWYFRMGVSSGATLSDISGRGYSAALNGGFTLSQAGALAVSTDTAISFNGSTGYASLSSLILPCVTAFTVECWFKVASTSNLSNTPRLISQDNAASNLKGFDFGVFPAGTTGAFFNVAVNGANKQAASSTVFSANTWYHMVAVFDGSFARLYTNGAQTASIAASGSMSISSNPLFLAALTGPANYLNGSLDECAGYGYALTADRIKAHYNAGINP